MYSCAGMCKLLSRGCKSSQYNIDTRICTRGMIVMIECALCEAKCQECVSIGVTVSGVPGLVDEAMAKLERNCFYGVRFWHRSNAASNRRGGF